MEPKPKKKMTITEKAKFMEERDDNKNYYDQFDRNSILYHEGCETPVPLGGKNVPESMPGMYPEGFDPNAPLPKDYSLDDPLCIDLKDAMASCRQFKKMWTKVADAFVSRRIKIAKAGRDDVKLMSKAIRKQLNDLKEFEEEKKQNETFTGYEAEQDQTLQFIDDCAQKTDLKLVDDIKKSVTKLTRQIFKVQQGCMQAMKARKKVLKEENEGKEEEKTEAVVEEGAEGEKAE
jgi:hypothetical protein